jgi:hypothetical protein
VSCMGEWFLPDSKVLLSDVLSSPAFALTPKVQAELAHALRETGFLVRTSYYVPDVDELFAMYHQLAEVDYHGRGVVKRSWLRWVMCGETQQALQRKYGQVKTLHTPNVDMFMAGVENVDDALLDEVHLVMTTRAARSIPAALDAGRLFDMPIRRDPAARRPLFELIPEQERFGGRS